MSWLDDAHLFTQNWITSTTIETPLLFLVHALLKSDENIVTKALLKICKLDVNSYMLCAPLTLEWSGICFVSVSIERKK